MNPANISLQVSGLSLTHTITESKFFVPILKTHSIKEVGLFLYVTVASTRNKKQQLFAADAREYVRLCQKVAEKNQNLSAF